MRTHCTCGKKFYARMFPYSCPCGLAWQNSDVSKRTVTIAEPVVKPSRWVRMVTLLRNASDSGVGDTVQRIAAKFGGERFKQFSAKIGIPCGCTERQEEWNRLFPYP